jgi:hypothetical protein
VKEMGVADAAVIAGFEQLASGKADQVLPAKKQKTFFICSLLLIGKWNIIFSRKE